MKHLLGFIINPFSKNKPAIRKGKYISGRDFIEMMRPMLGITQGAIVSITVTARHDDAARIDIECIAKSDCGVEMVDITASEDKPEKRRFIVEVTEVDQ